MIPDVLIQSQTQRIVVNPASGSISIINAGPMGPTGLTGPSDTATILTTDGDILTRISGAVARITRANLAADSVFSNLFVSKSVLVTNGDILTRAAGIPALITRANLAADTAFTSKFLLGSQGSGAPAGTGSNGEWYYDTVADRAYMSDGVGWIVMYEPMQTYTPSSTNISFGATSTLTGRFQRRAGRCIGRFSLYMGASGTSAVMGTAPTIGLPKTADTGTSFGDLDAGSMTLMYDATGPRFYGTSYISGTLAIGFQCFSAGTAGAGATVTATAPFTWAFGDFLSGSFDYLMSTPYL